jgi:hypothetical protein
MEPQMNIVAILVAALIPMIMGFIYYHPALMGNAWMKANGLTKESIGKGPKPALYVVALVCSFLLSFFIWAWVTGAGGLEKSQVVDPVDGHSYETFKHGAFHGIVFTITVLLPIFVTMGIFEKRSWAWAFINIGYWSLSVILMGGLLSAWR